MQLRRLDWLLVLFPLFLTWGIDQVTKNFAEGIRGLQFFGAVWLCLAPQSWRDARSVQRLACGSANRNAFDGRCISHILFCDYSVFAAD